MATVQGGSVARNARSWPRRSFLRKTTAPALVSPMELKDVFGEIEADGANLVHGGLLEWALTPPLWHAEAVGGVHTIKPLGSLGEAQITIVPASGTAFETPAAPAHSDRKQPRSSCRLPSNAGRDNPPGT